jgi:hypothetical protein
LLTGTSRTASNPINALLNYAYALLEVETRIACLTIGLDPGMGLFHADQKSRDSLALDLMEPVRPLVDRLILEILEKRLFTAHDFFETAQGNCRLMPSVTRGLAELTPKLAAWVGPVVEDVARQLSKGNSAINQPSFTVPTLLSQSRRSSGRDGIRSGERREVVHENQLLINACKHCGQILLEGKVWCDDCYAENRIGKDRSNIAKAQAAREQMQREGRDPAHGGKATEKRSTTQRENRLKNVAWEANPTHSMSVDEYRSLILPELGSLSSRFLAKTMGVSIGYAADVRKGIWIPHPRHWKALMHLKTDFLDTLDSIDTVESKFAKGQRAP